MSKCIGKVFQSDKKNPIPADNNGLNFKTKRVSSESAFFSI